MIFLLTSIFWNAYHNGYHQRKQVAIQIQTLDKAVCISLCTNAPGKGINPCLLIMGKLWGRLGF